MVIQRRIIECETIIKFGFGNVKGYSHRLFLASSPIHTWSVKGEISRGGSSILSFDLFKRPFAKMTGRRAGVYHGG
jgi:hypothetical protein